MDPPQIAAHSDAQVYADRVDGTSIRLLRFSQSEDGEFVGKLQTFRLASAPHFYTASYVWGTKEYSDTRIRLTTGSLPVLRSLAPFLHMVAQHSDFCASDWWWIDSLCINLVDGHERERQVRIMADIYKRAKRAIIWLGEEQEENSDCAGAIGFLQTLSTLQFAYNADDRAMRRHLDDEDFSRNCAAVSNLLFRPWWTRVWTLQEFVLPKEARLYCGAADISRGKFKSAIYSIFLCSTMNSEFENELVPRRAFDGAFNRRRIHQWCVLKEVLLSHTKQDSQGMGLVAIMAILGNHSATDSRDRIYSVLGLITGEDRRLVGAPEYSSSTEHQFARLVQSFWNEHNSLDIICFTHIFSRYCCPEDPGPDHAVPCWAPDWRVAIEFASPVPLMASQSATPCIGNFRPLRSSSWKAMYDAPGSQLRKQADVIFSEDLKEMSCNSAILGTIHGLGALDDRELRCSSFVCKDYGHGMTQAPEDQNSAPRRTMLSMDWLQSIARSLVLDRQDKYLSFQAPPQYFQDFLFLCQCCINRDPVDWSFASWFDQNRMLRFGSKTLEQLTRDIPELTPSSPPPLTRPPSYPTQRYTPPDSDRSNTFLSRFHDSIRKKARRLMVTNEGCVGMAPCRARQGDVVAILFGCSIPLVLRQAPTQETWQVIGEAYVHGYMNGEVAGLIKRGKMDPTRIRLV